MQKIRTAIGAEKDAVSCSALRGPKILDWLYGALSPRKLADIQAHVKLCDQCRRRIADIKKLAAALDDADQDRCIHTLIDIDDRGVTRRYVWSKYINRRHELQRKFAWHLRPGWTVEYLALQGQPVEFSVCDQSSIPDMGVFRGDLPSPVPLGQVVDGMFVVRTPAKSHWNAQPTGNGGWHYYHRHSPFPAYEGLFVITIRLPEKARLLSAGPAPKKCSARSDRLSLKWEVITEIVPVELKEIDWQFQAHIDYALDTKDS